MPFKKNLVLQTFFQVFFVSIFNRLYLQVSLYFNCKAGSTLSSEKETNGIIVCRETEVFINWKAK